MSRAIGRHTAARAASVPDPRTLMACAGKAKVLTAVVAGGGRAALRGTAGRVVKPEFDEMPRCSGMHPE